MKCPNCGVTFRDERSLNIHRSRAYGIKTDGSEKQRARMSRWRKKNSDYLRAYGKRQADNLTDSYVRGRLINKGYAPSPELICSYREILQMRRILKTVRRMANEKK